MAEMRTGMDPVKKPEKKEEGGFKLWQVIVSFAVGAGLVAVVTLTPLFGLQGFSRIRLQRTINPSPLTEIQVQKSITEKPISALDAHGLKNPQRIQPFTTSGEEPLDVSNPVESNSITRAEFAKIIVNAADIPTCQDQIYSDVTPDMWYFEDVCAVTKADLYSVYNGLFRPNDYVNRAEAAKVTHSAFDIKFNYTVTSLFSDVNTDVWYSTFVNELGALGAFNTPIGSEFKPTDLLQKNDAEVWMKNVSNLNL